MKNTFAALAAAVAVGAAGLTAAPQKAEAHPAWVVPAIVGGVVGGVVIGAAASQANANAYHSGYAYDPDPRAPRGTVYVRPTGSVQCHIGREILPDGRSRRIQVCD